MRRSWPGILLAFAFVLVSGLVWMLAGERGERIEPRPPIAEQGEALRDGAAVALAEPEDAVEPARTVAPLPAAIPEPEVGSSAGDVAASVTVRLRVLEHGSELPIGGARVQTFEDSAPGVVETDDAGECRLRVPSTSDPMRLHVERDGFFHVRAFYERRAELEVRLARTGTLHGRVLAADDGRPVPAAEILLVHGYCKGCEPAAVLTRDDGSYELAGVPLRREATLIFRASDFPRQWKRFEIRSEGPRVEQDFRLERGVEIAGRVVDFTTGAGVPGASVTDLPTDPAGRFRGRLLPHPERRTLWIDVQAEGYCQLQGSLDALAYREGEPIELRIPRGTTVAGTVRDASGEPVSGVLIRIDDDWETRNRRAAAGERPEETPLDALRGPPGFTLERIAPRGDVSQATTDAEGRYTVTNVVPWTRDMQLLARAEGYEMSWHALERAAGPGEVVRRDLVLGVRDESPPTARVEGEVKVCGVRCRTATGAVRWKGPTREGEGQVHSGDFSADVEPGTVELRIEVEGLPRPTAGDALHVQVKAGDRLRQDADLRFPTAPLSGQVTFADGAPAPGAEVTGSCALKGAGENWWDRLHVSVETDADGRYLLEVPDLGRTYSVKAELAHDECKVDGVLPGAKDVDLVLARPGRFFFRVVDAETRATLSEHDVDLTWRRSGEGEFAYWWPRSAPDAEGWVEDELPGGRLDLQARPELRGSVYLPVLVEDVLIPIEGEPPRIEFALLRGIVLTLRLADDGQPLPEDFELFLHREPDDHADDDLWGQVEEFVQFDEQRSATLRGLPPGPCRFEVFPADLVIEPATLNLEWGRSEPVVLRWRRGP